MGRHHPLIAHSSQKPGRPHQALDEHLHRVAELASTFAGAFGAGAWGRAAGSLHDIGKATETFQAYLLGARRSGGDHKSAGALQAFRDLGEGLSAPVALAVAGHHSGLPDWQELRSRLAEPELAQSLEEIRSRMRLPEINSGSLTPPAQALPSARTPDAKAEAKRGLELWTRMLYSCLVDADYLDTEAYLSPGLARERGDYPDVADLERRLDGYLDALSGEAPGTPVNAMRAQVLRACRDASRLAPGFFSLTVPTGGGKTYSALAFAFGQALGHGLRRVISVVPYTSIIEQTANAYRNALGNEAVVEHHSNLDPDEEDTRHRLASENWDAPVIATTSVQFLESLFARKPSRCRKLHNIPGSVVIFDEAQTLPPELLAPILEVLKELVANYGCSVVFCTATQPALHKRESLPCGLEGIREIVPDPGRTFRELPARVKVKWPRSIEAVTSWETLAKRVSRAGSALVVVHRRDDAVRLTRLLPDDTYHLSARMCAAHRSDVLHEIKRRLRCDETCRVVSTQLVEAGVDIDFPAVFRALGGLDSLAQAAGRCNREGRLDGQGRFEVFVAESSPPRGTPRLGFEVACTMLESGRPDLDDPAVYLDYFRRFYMGTEADGKGVNACRTQLRYRETAERFRIIESGGRAVVVHYGEANGLLEAHLRQPSRASHRKLQRSIVDLYPHELAALQTASALVESDGILSLGPQFMKLYDDRFGLLLDCEAFASPEDLVS